MFPPPWTVKVDEVDDPKNLLVLARMMKDREKVQSAMETRPRSAAPRTRLQQTGQSSPWKWSSLELMTMADDGDLAARPNAHCVWEGAKEKSTRKSSGDNSYSPMRGVENSRSIRPPRPASSVGGVDVYPSPCVDRLARPKNRSKLRVLPDNLFGRTAALPLQSQTRAQSRLEMMAPTRFRHRGRHEQNQRRCDRDRGPKVFQGNWGDTAHGPGGFRRMAWDDEEEVISPRACARKAIDARRQRFSSSLLEGDPETDPAPVERAFSEDSIGTDVLMNEGMWEASQGSMLLRKGSESWEIGSGDDASTRKAFFAKFREVANTKQTDPFANVTSIEEENVHARARQPSPRSPTISDALEEAVKTYLRQLSDCGRAPWPALLKLESDTRTLEVGGLGLGDDLAAALATVMPILRGVERLIAFDNRMTDDSVFRIVKAVQGMPTLTYLDLSENEVGTLAARELRKYMRSTQCRLRSLAIRKADIDDYECREFMQALGWNVSLLDVDLTANLIGTAETIKVIGGESIASMLSTNKTLTSLNLGWNSIRMASAVLVASSLRKNFTLLSLGLAYNSFGDYPTQILASALCENDTLTSMDLSYNSVTPAAAMVLAFALKVNRSMKFLELEGNRIGKNGGEALVMAMKTSVRSEGNLIVSVKNCDTSQHDETLFHCNNATGEYTLDLTVPYHKVVASELLRLANGKTTAHFRELKHVVGKKVTNIKLHREQKAKTARNFLAEATHHAKRVWATEEGIQLGHFVEFTKALSMQPEASVAVKMMEKWREVLARDEMNMAEGRSALESIDSATCCFFEALFHFADKNAKGELVVDDLETLFQELHLHYGNAKMRHVMTKYDTDHSGAIDLDEFIHYMTAVHIKPDEMDHGVLCTDDKKQWEVPSLGILRVVFLDEPNADRTAAEMSTDCGVEGLISNIKQSPNDDDRKRLFELATARNGIYFTASQAQGLLESVSSTYHLMDAVVMLMPQLASSQECTAFIDSNLDHRAKFKLRFMIGGAWGTIMGMPSGHYSLDMQNARDRLAAQKVAAASNHERQQNKFSTGINTSQHGNWHNFRNAEFKREPLTLHPTWFVDLPKYGVLRFDYAATSRPDHHHMHLPARRFHRMMARLGMSTPITCDTPIDEEVITEDELKDLCTSHWRKFSSSSVLSKIDMRDYFRSGSSLDDVSLASWWSAVDVTSVDLERKASFAYLTPSDTYVKAWYKLRELEVALCSACLTTEQLAKILQLFPRDGQIRAEVVMAFYHKVIDIEHMCLLVDALRPDEQREVFARRGFLNVVNPMFSDRYYRLDLSVWDEREMAKILIRLAMMEPGENWIDETYERKVELGPLPGWELPLDWTSPDVTAEKKDGGPRRVGVLTLWYSSAPQLGCLPNPGVRQELTQRTLCSKGGATWATDAAISASLDVEAYAIRQQRRFRNMLDKKRESRLLPTEEIAHTFGKNLGLACRGGSRGDAVFTAASSITSLGDEEVTT